MIKVDNNKLEQIILNSMSEMEISGIECTETINIYSDKNLQVHLTVTSDEDEFITTQTQESLCIYDYKGEQ